MAIKAPRVRVTSYLRNVGKSFGYAVGDVAGEYAPTLKSIVSDTKDTVDEFKMSSGDLKTSIKNMIQEYKTGVVANTIDDLKTGNWYNKKREDDALNEMFGGSFDFDDDDWGDGDWDTDNFDFSDSSDDTRDTKAIINSIDSVGEEISKNVAYSNARTAEYIVSNQRASTRAMYELTGKGFNQVSGILMNMSNTMVGLASLGEPLSQHIQNSSVFYTKTTESLDKITTSLDKLVERTTYMDEMNKKQSGNKKKGFHDIVAGGEFSLSSYFDFVKENTKDQLEMVSGFKEMFEMMGGKGGKNSSLAKFIPEFMIKSLMPKFFKTTLEQFNESINNALVNGLARAGRAAKKSDNFIVNLLGGLLFPDMGIKPKVDTSKYQRGPMQWDGEAKKALTDVIPTYLAKINAKLGGEEKYFNYETGKFESIGKIQHEKKQYEQSLTVSTGGEFRNKARSYANGNKDAEDAIDAYIFNAIAKDVNFYDIIPMSKGNKKDYDNFLIEMGLYHENVKGEKIPDHKAAGAIIATIKMSLRAGYGSKYRNMMTNFERDVNIAKGTLNQKYRDQEAKNGNWGKLEDEYLTKEDIIEILGGTGRKAGKTKHRQEVFETTTATKNSKNKYTVTKGNNKNVELSEKEYEQYRYMTSEEQDKMLSEKNLKQQAGKLEKWTKNKISNIGSGEKKGLIGTAKNLYEQGKYYVQRPFAAMAKVIDSFTKGINDLFWGDSEHPGIIDKIGDKIEEVWKKITSKLKEFGKSLKDKLKDLFPQEGESLKDAMKREAGNLKDYAIGRLFGGLDSLRSAKNAQEKFRDEYDRKVRSGQLKEFGESGTGSGLIHKLPSHRLSSGFKHGKRFKPTMYSGGESGVKETFTTNKGEVVTASLLKGSNVYETEDGRHFEKKIYKAGPNMGQAYYREISINGSNKITNAIHGNRIMKAHASNVKENAKEMFSNASNKVGDKAVNGIKDGASLLGRGIYDFLSKSIMGDDADPKKMEDQKKSIFDSLSKTMGDLSGAKGAMGIGAIGGVGVSLLTGALVGPIAGAAIGAGVGLATKSQAFQDFLFGEGDPESDDYKQGLLGGFGEALKRDGFKTVKGIGAGAGIGAGVGTLMGSPIVGALIGGAAGFVATNEKAKKKLFGDFDEEDPKTLRGKLIKTLKEKKVNIAAGVLATTIAGPFGFLPNILLGTGVGLLSTTEGFKDFMFGNKKKGIKGLTTKIHDRIINPLDDIMHNLAYAIKGGVRNLFDALSEKAALMFDKTKGLVRSLIAKHPLLDRMAKGVTNTAKKVVTTPVELAGSVLGRIDRATMKHNLKRGYNVYNRDAKRASTAKERMLTTAKLANMRVEVGEDGKYYQVDPFTDKRSKISKKRYDKLSAQIENGDFKLFGKSKYGGLDEAMANLSDAEFQEIYKDPEKYQEFIKQATGGMKLKPGDEKNIKDLFNDEFKGRGFDNKGEKADEAVISIKDYVAEIKDYLLFGKKPGNSEGGEGKTEENTGEEETKTEIDALGNTHQYVKNNEGEWVEDTADKETSKAKQLIGKFTDSIYQIPVIGGALKGISSGLSRFGKFLFGDDDKEGSSGLLGGLMGLLGGGINLIGKNLFGIDNATEVIKGAVKGFGKKAVGGLKSIGSKLFTKEAASFLGSNVLAPALLIAGMSGAFDGIASKLTGDSFNEKSADESATYNVTTADGEQVTAVKDENGNFVDPESGKVLKVTSVDAANRGRDSLGDKLKKNAIRGGLTGGSSVLHSVFKHTALGKKLFKAPGKKLARKMMAANATSSIMEYGGEATLMLMKSNITDLLKDVAKKLKGIKVIQNLGIDIDGMMATLSEKIGKKMSSSGAKNLAKNAAKFASFAAIAFVVTDFITGYEDARTTLGIIDEPSTGQRIIAGLLRVIKNCIPIVGTLIPDELVIDVFCDYVAPALGVDVEELKGQRQKAQETVDQWNATHEGSNLSVGDFNKQVLKDYTFTERIANSTKRTWEDTKTKFSNFKDSVKEKGLGGALKDSVSNMATTFMDSYEKNGGGIAGIWSGIGDTFQNMLPGVLGDIAKANADIMKFAAKGEISNLWKVSIVDKGGEKIEGTDLTTAVPSIFTKILGQIPVITTKVLATPGAFVAKLGISIKEKITQMVDKIKSVGNAFDAGIKSGEQKIIEGNPEGYFDTSDISEDPENPLSGIMKASALVGRVAAFPLVWFKAKVVKPIKDWIVPKIEAIKTDAGSFNGLISKTIQDVANSDAAALGESARWEASEENPIGGIFELGHGFAFTIGVIGGTVKKTINSVKDFFGEKIDKFKTEGENYSSSADALKIAAEKSDFKSILATTYEPSEEAGGVAGTIYKTMFKFAKAGALISAAFNKVMDPVKNIVSGVVDTAEKIGTKLSKLTDGALGTIANVVKTIFGIGDDEDKVEAGETPKKSGGIVQAATNLFGNVFNASHEAAQTYANPSGGASGFVSQFDPRYQNYQISGSNFAGKGCGPAVASMTAAALGKNLPVGSAVSAARGYQASNGVTLDYFQRALGSQGIDTQYISGGGAGDLYDSIASGKKVVLLGQDRANTSKANSPFGPNNHYVVATGLDRSGNVVVNDPELNGPVTYSPGILNSVKYGVAAGRSGLRRVRSRIRRLAGGASGNVAEQVWAFFTSKGFSEVATASIMGNLQAESGMDPSAVQKGSGKAAGIAQWEDFKAKEGRWLNLKNFAEKLGVDWTNLDAQLNFLLAELSTKDMDQRMQGKIGESNFPKAGLSKSEGMTFEFFKTQNKDIARGVRIFEAAFERAGVQAMEKRINAAKDYYAKFSGKEYTYESSTTMNSSAQEALANMDSGTVGATEAKESKMPTSIFGVLGAISSAFSNAFSGAFKNDKENSSTNNPGGLNPEGEDVNDVVSNSASAFGPRIGEKISQILGGKAQPHPEGKGNASSVVDIARSQLGVTEEGENITDYGKFTGADKAPWCASFASWVFDKAFNGNKEARNKALRGGTSASVSTFLNNFKKANALKETPQPGDLVIYKNGTSHIGIVEDVQGNQVYTIEGNTSGDKGFDRNGGVVYRKSFDYTNRSSGNGKKLTGFGRPDWSYTDLANAAGGSSGILMRSRAGSSGSRPAFVDPSSGRIVPFTRFAGGATNIADASRNMLQQISTNAAANNNKQGNGVSPELISQLLSAITSVLNTIANNTAPVDKIYQALVAYLEAGGDSGINKKGNTTININKSPEKAAAGAEGQIDSKLKALVSTLADLAKG